MSLANDSAGSSGFEILAEQFVARLRQGESVDIEGLARQWPEHAERIRSLFPLMAALERAGAPESVAAGDVSLAHALWSSSKDGRRPGDESTLGSDRPESGAWNRGRSAPPGDFGDYELLAEIGRGGMGVVYKARQKSLDRIVALKVILDGRMAGEEAALRFEAEARAAARLDHAGIVPVYDFGAIEGRRYLAMAFIEGETLAARCSRGPLAPVVAAEFVRQIAQAIAYAHGRNIIHRDLKPANVLVTEEGRCKVSDFGLAKRLGPESHESNALTLTGQILGTPSFMAPEQAGAGEIGKAADIYSLGAVLYCLITGRPPFQADNVLETLRQVLESPPASPRLLSPSIPADLESICLKCLEKNPQDRYASAADLADDLGRFLAGDRVEARRSSLGYVLKVWTRKHLRSAVWAVALGLAFGVLFGVSSLAWLISPADVQEAVGLFREFPQLGRPSFPWDLLESLADSGRVVRALAVAALPMLFLFGIPTLAALVRRFARSADISQDAAAGAVAGLVAGAAALASGLGWASYHHAALAPLLESSRQLRLLPSGAGGGPTAARAKDMLERLVDRRPKLQSVPLERRAEIHLRQSAVWGSSRAVDRIVQTVLITMFGFPLVVTLETVLLGQLHRRQRSLLEAPGASAEVRRILEKRGVKAGRWRQFVGAPYYAISLTAAVLLAAAALLAGWLPLQRIEIGPLGAALTWTVLAAALTAFAGVVYRRTVTTRRLFHAHQALLEEHGAELTGRSDDWFAVVASSSGDGHPQASIGLLIVAPDGVRYLGRTLSGERVSQCFHPQAASAQLRNDWRTLRLGHDGPSAGPMRPYRAAPGWLSFTIDSEEPTARRTSFYGVPLFGMAPVEKSVFALRPPTFDDGDDIPADEEGVLRCVFTPLTTTVVPFSRQARDEFMHGRYANAADRRTCEAYRAVRQVLARTGQRPADAPPADNPAAGPAAPRPQDISIGQSVRRPSSATRLGMSLMRCVAITLAVLTFAAPLAVFGLGVWKTWRLPTTTDRYLLAKSPYTGSLVRIDLPPQASAAWLGDRPTSRWRVRDGAGELLFDISVMPGLPGLRLDLGEDFLPFRRDTFVRERLLEGAELVQSRDPDPSAAELVSPIPTQLAEVGADGAVVHRPARIVEHFRICDGQPVWIAFTIPEDVFPAAAPLAARSAKEVSLVDGGRLDSEQRAHAAPSRGGRLAAVAGAAAATFVALAGIFLSCCLLILFVQAVLVSSGRLFPVVCDAQTDRASQTEAARHNAPLAEIGFLPAGNYRLDTFESPRLAIWKRHDEESICFRRKPLGDETWCFLTRFEGDAWLLTSDRVSQILSDPFPGRYNQSFEQLPREQLWEKHRQACDWLLERGLRPAETRSHAAVDLFYDYNVAQANHVRRRPWRLPLAPFLEPRRRRALKDRPISDQPGVLSPSTSSAASPRES